MLIVKTYLSPSNTHGMGVFADEDIKKGSVVWEFTNYVDKLLSEEEFEALPEKPKEFITEYGWIDKDFSRGMIICADNARFINHADFPNTHYTTFTKSIANRDIAKGEELTCDYRELCMEYADLPYVNIVENTAMYDMETASA